jgi:gluconate 2-dehydrogenase subunit 3-like protein
MPEPGSIEAVRAAVDAIVPGTGDRPGGAELGVHLHVVDAMDRFLPGFVDLAATILDAYAVDVRPGTSFTELGPEERLQVIRAMSLEDNVEMQDIVDGLLAFTYGGMYSEWTAYDRETRQLRPPRAWADMGFNGPSDGHPRYSQEEV